MVAVSSLRCGDFRCSTGGGGRGPSCRQRFPRSRERHRRARSRVAELPEARMFGGLREDRSSLSGAEVQGLAAGHRDAQRFPGLAGDGLHRGVVIRRAAERYFLPFPGIDAVWR